MKAFASQYEQIQRPNLSLNEFIRMGFLLTKTKWQLLLGLYCGIFLPGAAAAYFCNLNELPNVVGLGVGALAKLVFTVFCALIVESEVRGVSMPTSALMRYGLQRIFPALLTFALYGAATGIGFIALVIPGLILGIFLQFAVFASVTRNESGVSALKYSWRLVQERWWYAFACRIMFGFMVPMVLSLPLIMVVGTADQTSAKALLMNTLISELSSIPGYVMLVLVFLNFDYQSSSGTQP